VRRCFGLSRHERRSIDERLKRTYRAQNFRVIKDGLDSVQCVVTALLPALEVLYLGLDEPKRLHVRVADAEMFP
jgi:hypothetical protein